MAGASEETSGCGQRALSVPGNHCDPRDSADPLLLMDVVAGTAVHQDLLTALNGPRILQSQIFFYFRVAVGFLYKGPEEGFSFVGRSLLPLLTQHLTWYPENNHKQCVSE